MNAPLVLLAVLAVLDVLTTICQDAEGNRYPI